MIFNRGIDTMKITALSNHKPEILNNYIRMNNLTVNQDDSIRSATLTHKYIGEK